MSRFFILSNRLPGSICHCLLTNVQPSATPFTFPDKTRGTFINCRTIEVPNPAGNSNIVDAMASVRISNKCRLIRNIFI